MKLRIVFIAFILGCIILIGCSQQKDVNNEDDLPAAYRDIIIHCSEIIDRIEAGDFNLSDSEGSFYWFADQVMAMGVDDSRKYFCYSLTDINNDGINELVLSCRCITEHREIAYKAGYIVFNVYTLNGDEAVLLAESWLRCNWYINSEGQFINELSSAPAYHEIYVYSFKENDLSFTEEYHVYNAYLEDSKEVGLFESVNGNPAELLNKTDAPNNSILWEKFTMVREQYTLNPYELELVQICPEK